MAGLLALALVGLVDAFAFRLPGLWDWLAPRMQRQLFAGIVEDRRELTRLEGRGPRDLVVFLGSSRAKAGLRFDELGPDDDDGLDGLDGLELGLLAHAGIDPFVMRSFAGAIADLEPSTTCLVLSEFDTHHSLDLRPRSTVGARSANGEA